MNLSDFAPSPTATMFFTLPGSNDRIKTDDGKDMKVVVYGSDTAEYKAAQLAFLRVQTSVNEERLKADGEGAEFTEDDKQKLKDAANNFLKAIIKSVLFQVDGKTSQSVDKFVTDETLEYFHGKTREFARNVSNFLKAQPTS